MSQQELEHGDQQVMGMVNGHSHPEAAAAAEKIVAAAQDPAVHTANKRAGGTGDTVVAELRRQILYTTIQVLSCILAALLFVAALMDPAFLIHLANVGVLICGMWAAVLIDRAVRLWKRR